MARNYRYISGDSHLEIDAKWWVGRVPKKYRDQAPRLVRLPDGSDAWAIEGQPLRQVPFDLYGGKGRDVWRPYGQNYATTPGTGPAEQRLQEQHHAPQKERAVERPVIGSFWEFHSNVGG